MLRHIKDEKSMEDGCLLSAYEFKNEITMHVKFIMSRSKEKKNILILHKNLHPFNRK